MRIRKLLAAATLTVASVSVVGAVSTAPASATANLGTAVPCGYVHPTAPNAVDYCLGWIHEPGSVWSYRIEASHHAGWWGGNHDPGTWHVFVDRYVHSTGDWQEREIDKNFGDQNVPKFYNTSPNAGAALYLFPGYAIRLTDSSNFSYMSCGAWYQDSKSTFVTREWTTAWPYGYTGSQRNGTVCQNGSGFVAWNVVVDNNVDMLESGFFFKASRILLPR